jgi:hypothetical protein
VPGILPIDPGTAAEWAGVGIGAAGLIRRRERAEDFQARLLEDTGRTADALMEVMEHEDLFSEIVERGMQAASRSASASKRRLLARVVASALDGTGMATPDDHLLLVKTADAIEPAHVQLLVLVCTPQANVCQYSGTAIEGALTEFDVVVRWPEVKDTFRPLIATLVREGLAEDAGAATYRQIAAYRPTRYGRMFLRFLAQEDLGSLRLGEAHLAARYEDAASQLSELPQVVVKNLGPGRALQASVESDAGIFREELGSFDLEPGDSLSRDTHPATLVSGPPYRVLLSWTDERGPQLEQAVVAKRVEQPS